MESKNIITIDKINKYYKITKTALELAKKSITKSKIREAEEIILMVDCYLKDSIHFKNNKDYINSFAAINYAHGWLDSGARLKIFNVTDDKLFTI